MKKIIWFAFFFCMPALAAQFGKIIVDSANVYEFPQAKAKVVTRVQKDLVMVVSNLPTEGFFKVRTPTGDTGWVSGNDIFVAKTMDGAATAVAPDSSAKPAQHPSGPSPTQADDILGMEEHSSDFKEHSRIIFAGGLHSFSYAGVPSGFDASSLNYGWDGLIEFQFKLMQTLYWCIRTEIFTSTSGDLKLGSGVTQNLSHLDIPLELGLQFSPLTTRRFRLGVGAYVGGAWSSLKISQTTTSTTGSDSIGYTSIDPSASLALQMNIGIGKHAGIFAEAAYRYEQSSAFKASTNLGGVQSFKASFSGISGRVGIEFRL